MIQSAVFRDYFNSLVGEWSLLRTVSSGENLKGRIEFSSNGSNRLDVAETGELRIADGNLISASRKWIWLLDGATLKICFDEEPLRLYHKLTPVFKLGRWRGEDSHDCPPDTYVGEYLFSPNKIVVRQDVMGPKKDYHIVSEYNRMESIRTS